MPDTRFREGVIDDIDTLLGRLDRPIEPAELGHGWTPENVGTVCAFFVQLRDAIAHEEPLTRTLKRPSLARDFSDLGIIGGQLMDSAAKIGNDVYGSGM